MVLDNLERVLEPFDGSCCVLCKLDVVGLRNRSRGVLELICRGGLEERFSNFQNFCGKKIPLYLSQISKDRGGKTHPSHTSNEEDRERR